MITVYTFSLLDFFGNEVKVSNNVYASAKQAAAVATQLLNVTPPAGGIKVHKRTMFTADVCKALNEKG